ncbi:MAG: hypothetical protein ACYCYR_17620 [Desulfobulbaceae bacterium]
MVAVLTLFFALLLSPVNCFASPAVAPCSGQVTDSMTGEPLAGALVLFYWDKIEIINEEFNQIVLETLKQVDDAINQDIGEKLKRIGSSTADAVVILTDEKGRYALPPRQIDLDPNERLVYARLVVYQPGYRLFSIGRPYEMPGSHINDENKDFAETNYQVRLDRVPPFFDHRAHFEEIEGVVNEIDAEFRLRPSRLLKRRAEWEQFVEEQ